ncbi:MAG TPA: tetratricopeptide repeat protein [Candidatus Nitrosotalea sp.]|nr:tetratricopeptide repeat protein [Candidatus Nitrosotalea sp.]
MTESLADLLRLFRSTAHLSQETLAERAGLSTRTVSDIETGVARTPRLITVMLLAEALGLAASERTRLQEAARRPAKGGAAAPNAAARPVPLLLGRDEDLQRLTALLADDSTRLATLAGPAGVGKTSLAIRVAIERERAGDMVSIAELASIADPSHVAAAIAQALGIRESGDTPASEAVGAYLQRRKMLLVLDNLEHVLPAAPWIGALIAGAPGLTVLATSREPLHLREERIFTVRPLARDSAVALFMQRAQMTQPEFQATAKNTAAIDSIVDHLEGLPLAIELAAPRLSLLGPKALAARLERRLPLLGDGAQDRPERHQTMHRAIAWSYDLLSEEEQRCFRRLSVLQGGGDLDAAAAVAGDHDERPMVFQLAPLVEKNMLSLAEDSEGEPRVAMLEMLREYAEERLAESGEQAETQARHAAHMLALVERVAPELSGAKQAIWLARLERELRNVNAALDWAARNDEALFGCRFVAAIWRFWWVRGYLTQGVAWLRRFLDARVAAPQSVPESLYGKVLRAHVVLLSALGNLDEAYESCRLALEIQRRIGDDNGLAASLTSLGIILQFRGDFDGAEAAHREALEIRQRSGDRLGIASSLSNLSAVAFSKNELARAGDLGEESVTIYRQLGHESGIVHALTKIGLVAAARGEYERAEEIFGECLRIQRALGSFGNMHYSLINLGFNAHRRGEYGLALRRYHEALDLLDSAPNKTSLARTLEGLATTIAALGDPSRAARLYGAGEALRSAIGSPLFPSERIEYEISVAQVRAMIEPEAFDVQWRIGASITFDRALAEAHATRPGEAETRHGVAQSTS